MNQIKLVPSVEESRSLIAIHIDGRSLREILPGRLDSIPPGVSPLGWNAQSNIEVAKRFLLELPGEFPNGRVAILVCEKCGDLGCGAVSVRIERIGDIIQWSEFGYENNYEDVVDQETYAHILPLQFSWVDYESEFQALIRS
jgi:hypothetical protein